MDLVCTGCQASISSISSGNVYACAHLLCETCGLDQNCRVDGSYTVMHDTEVVQCICAIQETFLQVQSVPSESQDWNTYFAAVSNLQTLVGRKYAMQCQNGHHFVGDACSRCLESAQLSQAPPPLEWVPNYCPNCKVGISGTCPTCHYKDLSAVMTVKEEEVKPRNCSRCGQESEEELCWQCQQPALTPTPPLPQSQPPAQSPHWKCSNCNYKYCNQSLTDCPSCHKPKA